MTDTGIATIPRPVSAGEETEALRRFHRDVTWTGGIEEGGMGPGTPAQIANGKAIHHWIQDGRWVVGEFEQDQFLEDGTFVLKWELHWVCGWDRANAEYRATVADCYGHTEIMRGRIEGDLMIFESMRDEMPKLTMTWDASSPEFILWRNEMTFDGVDGSSSRSIGWCRSADLLRQKYQPFPPFPANSSHTVCMVGSWNGGS